MNLVGTNRFRRCCLRFFSTLVAVFLLDTAAMAEIKPGQLYLLLSTSKTETLQKEMDEAIVEGFRILATTSRGGGQVVLLRRNAPKGEEFGYRVLGTTKVDTVQKEMNEAAEAGYCMIPGTMLSRDRVFGPPEIVVFMVRSKESTRRCDYRVLGTNKTGTMESELVPIEEEGFKFVDIAQASGLTAVLEREK